MEIYWFNGFAIVGAATKLPAVITLFTDFEFYIYGAHDILDSNAKVVLEEVVINFVSNIFTDESSAIVSFTIDNQQIIYDHENRLRKRKLSDATLLINGKIVVRTIDETVTSNSLKSLISNMIDSSTFQERLNDETILSELVVSSSLRIDVGGSPDIGTTKDTSPTKKALTISTIVAVLCSVVLLVGFMYKKQKQLKYSKQLSPDNKVKPMCNDSEGSLWEDATQPHHNNISKVDYEDEQGSFNSKLLEQSNSAEEMKINLHLFPKSPTRLKSEPESVIPHIPSMIIFDNIDDENNMSPSEGSRSSSNSRENYASKNSLKVTPVTMGMPVKRVDASSELMEILSSKKIQNPNQAYSLLTAMKSTDDDDLRKIRSSDDNSPKTFASSQLSTGEAASVLSTPCCLMMTQNATASPSKRNVFIFDGSDRVVEEDFAVIFDKMTQSEKKKSISLRKLPLFKKKDEEEDENDQVSFSLHSHFESEDEVSDESIYLAEQGRKEVDAATFKPDDGEVKNWTYSGEFNEQNHIAEKSDDKIRQLSEALYSVPSPQKCSEGQTYPELYHYTFMAPITGKLGIVIVGNPHPTVHDVKSYSPLFGKIHVGDVITSIDGESTTSMTVSDITRFIDLRRSINNGSQKLKITVMSNTPKIHMKDDIQYKVDEKIKHDLFVEKYEELDTYIHQTYSADSDNRSCHLLGHLREDDSSESCEILKNL